MCHSRFFPLVLALSLFLALSVGVSAQTEFSPLLGEWQCDVFGQTLALVFKSDSRLVFDGESASFALGPGVIKVSDGVDVTDYGYELEGDTLLLSFPEGYRVKCSKPGNASRYSEPEPPVDPGQGSAERRSPPAYQEPAKGEAPVAATGNEPAAPPVISKDEIGDPSWGFKFSPPSGWKWKRDYSGTILGHDKIPGMILVIPHQLEDLESLTRQMQEGLREEGVVLRPSGQLIRMQQDVLAMEFTGVMDGQQVKGRAYGTLSPYGGGAFVLGFTTPEKYGEGVVEAAGVIPTAMSYFKVNVSELIRHFAGMWAYYSGGSGGGTLINYEFYPDGTFSDTSETSYSGEYSSDGWSSPDSYFGATGVNQNRARWTVRGNLQQGLILITYPNGNERSIEYRVYMEGGKTYSREYVFNGRHFSKRKDY